MSLDQVSPSSQHHHRSRSLSHSEDENNKLQLNTDMDDMEEQVNDSPGRSPSRHKDIVNPGNNLYVANLATRISQVELQELFGKYGRVEKCEVIVDPVTRESRGFGFVTFEDVRDAQDAVKELNDQEVQGRKIRVEHAKRKRGHEKTPGKYLGPRLASAKYGGRDRSNRDRSRDRGRRSRSRDRAGFSRRHDERERRRYNDRDRGRGRYDDRDRGRGGYDRDTHDDRRRR